MSMLSMRAHSRTFLKLTRPVGCPTVKLGVWDVPGQIFPLQSFCQCQPLIIQFKFASICSALSASRPELKSGTQGLILNTDLELARFSF